MVTTTKTSRTYTCNEVAELTGVLAYTLRVWEKRYGWPKPQRDPHNGYRVYVDRDVENVWKVAKLIRQGWSIGQLVRNGKPAWPRGKAKPSKMKHGVASVMHTVDNPLPPTLAEPEVIEAADDGEECRRCGAHGGDALICDRCSGAFCSKCDTGGKCPSCGEPLP